MASEFNCATVDEAETIHVNFEVEEENFDDMAAANAFFHSGNEGDEFTEAVSMIFLILL